MASPGDEDSPPGISGQRDSDDDSVNNDEAGRDVAFYYKDDGSEVRGPYSRDTFSRWFHAGHFPRGTVLSLDDQFADIAGTAEELGEGRFRRRADALQLRAHADPPAPPDAGDFRSPK